MVKIWNCRALASATHSSSVYTYSHLKSSGTFGTSNYSTRSSRITDLVVCDSSHSVAAASSNGQLNVFRVEYAPSGFAASAAAAAPSYSPSVLQDEFAFAGITASKFVDASAEGAVLKVLHFNTSTESMLVYATQKGLIHGWDLRARREVCSFFSIALLN